MLAQYNLTARLLGDPRPDRFENSERIKARVTWRPPVHVSAAHVPHQSSERRILDVMTAIAGGSVTAVTIATAIGVSRDMASTYLKRARERDLVEIASQVNHKAGGRIFQYSLTPAGRAALGK